MKKLLLTLAIGLLGIGSTYAERVTLWEGTQNLQWSAKPEVKPELLQDLQEGCRIYFTYYNPTTSWTSLQVVTLNWFKIPEYNSSDYRCGKAAAVPYSATPTETYRDPVELDVQYMKQKGFGCMGNNVTLTKIEYDNNPPAPVVNPVVWEGSQVLGWSMNPTIIADKFYGLKNGAHIKFTYEQDPAKSAHMLGFFDNWTPYTNGATNNVWPGTTEATFELSDKDVVTATTKGMGVAGDGLTLKKVEFINDPEPLDHSILYKGNYDANDYGFEIAWNNLEKGGIKEGVGIVVDCTPLPGYIIGASEDAAYVNFLWAGSNYTWNEFTPAPKVYQLPTGFTMEVSAENLEQLKDNKLVVQLGHMNLTKIQVVENFEKPATTAGTATFDFLAPENIYPAITPADTELKERTMSADGIIFKADKAGYASDGTFSLSYKYRHAATFQGIADNVHITSVRFVNKEGEGIYWRFNDNVTEAGTWSEDGSTWTCNDPEGCSAVTFTGSSAYNIAQIEVSTLRIGEEKLGLVLSTNEMEDYEDQTIPLYAFTSPQGNVTWASDNEAVATIDNAGNLTLVDPGQAVITATYGYLKSSINLNVLKVTHGTITLQYQALAISLDKYSQRVKATITPDDATYQEVYWKSSDESVATVTNYATKNGSIYPEGLGTCIITAYTKDASVELPVTITPVFADGIEIEGSQDKFVLGEVSVISLSTDPYQACDQTAEWSCSDPEMVKLTTSTLNYGKKVTVEFLKAGKVTLKAKWGELEASKEYEVLPSGYYSLKYDFEDYYAKVKSNPWGLKPGEQLVNKVLPLGCVDMIIESAEVTSDAGYATFTPGSTVEFRSNDTNVRIDSIVGSPSVSTHIQVSYRGITPSIGTINGSVWYVDDPLGTESVIWTLEETGTNMMYYTVKVHRFPTPESVVITGIDWDPYFDEAFPLKATVSPDAAYLDPTIVWSSSDDEIASVNQNGFVTCHKMGKVTISATCAGTTGSIELNVTCAPTESISLNMTSFQGIPGSEVEIVATVNPSNGDPNIIWTSSDEKVATVNENGLVSLIANGRAIITAQSGDKTATCEVIVDENSGILDILAQGDSTAEYYNLQGIRVEAENLTPGMYLVVKDGKAYKVAVK